MKYYCKNCKSIIETGAGISLIPDEEPCHGTDEHLCPICESYMLESIPEYETPAQYEKRTGNAYLDCGLVWIKHPNGWDGLRWDTARYTWGDARLIVIADPPVPPPDDWKPGENVQEEEQEEEKEAQGYDYTESGRMGG